MFHQHRVRLGLGCFTLAVTVAVALGPSGAIARAHGAPAASPSPLPGFATTPSPAPAESATPLTLPGAPAAGKPLNAGQPTPFPLTTLAPLDGTTTLPYPAYGTPVPGVDAGKAPAGIQPLITLQQAEMVAFARSPLLASARADVGVEAAAVRLERAGLLPSLSGTISTTYAHQQAGDDSESSFGTTTGTGTGTGTSTTTGTTTATGFSNHQFAADFGLTLTQLIYDGGRTAAAVEAAQRTETSSADTYRRDLQTVAYNVATAYYNYLAAQRTTQVDLEIVREDQVQVNLVEAQVRAGTEARAEVATVLLPLAQARLAVVRSQGTELADEAAFANAMGLDANARVQPIDDAPVFTTNEVSTLPVPTYDAAVKRALALRPDYDSNLQVVAQAKYSLRSASLGMFPTLSASGAADNDSSDGRAGSFRNSQQIGVSLSVPIFDQGITAANVAQAKANLDIAYANLQNEALTVQLNVKQALTGLVSARAALDQTQQEYSTAVTNLQSTQAQYKAGVTTLPLLLNAQVQLTQALTDQVTAVYTLRQAEQTYLYQIGANFDTSPDNGTNRVRPTPGPEAQGGKMAKSGKSGTLAHGSSPARSATAVRSVSTGP
jgi:outer membrane protein TolC